MVFFLSFLSPKLLESEQTSAACTKSQGELLSSPVKWNQPNSSSLQARLKSAILVITLFFMAGAARTPNLDLSPAAAEGLAVST